jgi:endoglycosylceramidase
MGSNSIAKPEFSNFVYSPHFYDPFVIMYKTWFGNDPATSLDNMSAHAAEWDVPLLLGEYGAPAETSDVEGYMDALNAWLNTGMHSGTQWNYTPTWRADTKDGWNHEDLSIVDDSGELRANFRPRVYPSNIAGTDASFSESESSFTLSWTHDNSLGSTEIFIPEGFMQDKTLATEGNIECETNQQILVCNGSGGSVSVKVE